MGHILLSPILPTKRFMSHWPAGSGSGGMTFLSGRVGRVHGQGGRVGGRLGEWAWLGGVGGSVGVWAGWWGSEKKLNLTKRLPLRLLFPFLAFAFPFALAWPIRGASRRHARATCVPGAVGQAHHRLAGRSGLRRVGQQLRACKHLRGLGMGDE